MSRIKVGDTRLTCRVSLCQTIQPIRGDQFVSNAINYYHSSYKSIEVSACLIKALGIIIIEDVSHDLQCRDIHASNFLVIIVAHALLVIQKTVPSEIIPIGGPFVIGLDTCAISRPP
jgi:hypothetical protein